MEITIEKKDSTNANIVVNLREADYLPKVAEKLKEYSKKAQLKGFRPGKVPTSLIEKMYGKSILVDEINHLLTHSLSNYIKDNNLPIIGDPLPDTQKTESIDWENQKEFVFNYNVGLIPEFTYDLSQGLNVKEYQIEVTPQVVEETLGNLRSQFGKNVPAEKVEEKDTVTGKLKEGEETKDVTFILAKANPAGAKNFIGHVVGDVVNFQIEQLFEDKAVLAHALGIGPEEAESKSGNYEFTIESISRTETAPLDQEFFDKVFGKDVVKTEEEFLSKLKDTIADNYARESEFLFKRDLQQALVKTTSIEFPNEFLKRWLLVSNQGKITEAQIEQEYDYYLAELKWNLVKNKVAKDNDIKVENEEVLDKAKQMIRQQFGGMDFGPEMEETLNNIADNYLKQEKGKNYLRMYDEIILDKIVALAKTKVNPEKKSISVDEFKTLAGA